MLDILREPLHSKGFQNARALTLEDPSAYLFAFSIEDRSRLAPDWMQRHPQTLFVQIAPEDRQRSRFGWDASGNAGTVALRSERELDAFLSAFAGRIIYVDITGLPHFTWIPLLRAALRTDSRVRVVYAEPEHYIPGLHSPEAELYQLSDRISNAEPLPGFASLKRETTAPALISLLGFEGGRFARVQQIVQTTRDRIFPVIGIPGFEPDYPFVAYFANRVGLRVGGCWTNLAFASANCPFSALAQLEFLAANRVPQTATIKVAMVGTKPHALGALLFFLRSTRDVELIYDHPIARAGRTTGSTRCWVYDISDMAYRSERLTSRAAS